MNPESLFSFFLAEIIGIALIVLNKKLALAEFESRKKFLQILIGKVWPPIPRYFFRVLIILVGIIIIILGLLIIILDILNL